MSTFQNLPPPKPMLVEGDLGANWKKFKKSYLLYSTATELTTKNNETQAAILLHCLGEEALEIFETLELSEEEAKQPNVILEKLELYFIPKSNQSVESHKFNTRVQGPSEVFDDFLADLRKLSINCEFGNLRDRLLRDRIVSGIRDQKVKERLLRETELSLTKAIDICRAAEQTESHIKLLLNQPKNIEVNVIKGKSRERLNESRDQENRSRAETKNHRTQNNCRAYQRPENKFQGRQRNCGRCGYRHNQPNCPAMGKQCNKCKEYNHFAKVCRNNMINVLEMAPESTNDYVLASLESRGKNLDLDWSETLRILDCDKSVSFKIDTGAHVNVIPAYIFETLNLRRLLKKTNITI
ncbi:uncharacterized protein LOC111629653 [Centruroides sculpturatus]|uniref:uncharacterized protein LOC111629653 n=1 Tax=Centruroides sculpturatus TaxID=218467 RepID=UPI000C6D49A1|nr:uncharacterized protein LOC111629653 [Centruroides sculpturatus]